MQQVECHEKDLSAECKMRGRWMMNAPRGLRARNTKGRLNTRTGPSPSQPFLLPNSLLSQLLEMMRGWLIDLPTPPLPNPAMMQLGQAYSDSLASRASDPVAAACRTRRGIECRGSARVPTGPTAATRPAKNSSRSGSHLPWRSSCPRTFPRLAADTRTARTTSQ